jgi:PilZ domain
MKPTTTVISDRRAHDRYPLHTDIALLASDGRQFPGRMLDIGKGGMAVVIDINPAVGTRYAVQARLPTRPAGNAAFEAQVTVASCVLATGDGGFRVGLQFAGLSATAQDVLKRCLP